VSNIKSSLFVPTLLGPISRAMFCGLVLVAWSSAAVAQTSESQPAPAADAVAEPAAPAAAPAPAEKKPSKSVLNFELRSDLLAEKYKNQKEEYAGDDSKTFFKLNRARLGLQGNVTEDLKYRVRFRFDKSYEPKSTSYTLGKAENGDPKLDDTGKSSLDGVGEALDLAFVDYQYASFGGVEAGKFNTNMCGADGMSSIDSYSIKAPVTLAIDKCVSQTLTRTGVGFYFLPTADHRIELIAANSPEGDSKQQDLMYGFLYSGKLLDGMIAPRATFHNIPLREIKKKGGAEATKKGVSDVVFNVGSDFKFADATVKVDYVSYTQADQTVTGAKKGDTKYNTIAGRVSYRIGEFEPMVVVDSSTLEEGSATKVKTDVLGLSAIVQYYPTTWKKMRFHAGYLSQTSKADTKDAKEIGTTAFLLGTAFVSEAAILN
jgi:hypothetical protein